MDVYRLSEACKIDITEIYEYGIERFGLGQAQKYWFGPHMVHLYVKWIGTHAEYTKLCKQKLQFSIDDFS